MVFCVLSAKKVAPAWQMMAPVRLLFVATFVFQVTRAIPSVPPASSEGNVARTVFSGSLFGIGASDATAGYTPVQQQQYSDEWGTGLCDKQCTCGVPNRNTRTRIIGGNPTLTNEYPWVAAIIHKGHVFCGGTVITNLHVLTAAHCVHGNQNTIRRTTMVLLAEHDIWLANKSPVPLTTRRISSIVRHPSYRHYSLSYGGDIALIRMSHPVDFTAQLMPACLPSPGEDFAGYKGIVVGWGRTSEKGNTSHKLLEAVVPILSQDFCKRNARLPHFFVTEHMVCAGPMEGGVDSCSGDSGGGLFVTDTFERMAIAGIVSWGRGCARPRSPGIYTRVNHYLTWIQNHTKDACFCA